MTLDQYQKQYDKEVEEQDYYDREIAELMSRGGECYPYSKENFSDATGMEYSDEYEEALRLALAEGNYAEAGHITQRLVEKYWYDKAEKLVTKRLNERDS